jgi:hypothetical protein
MSSAKFPFCRRDACAAGCTSELEFINKMKRQLERHLFGMSTFQMEFMNIWQKYIFSPVVKEISHAQ